MTVEYEEMPGSPTEEYDATTGASIATRVFVCDWEDRYELRDLLLYGLGTQQYEYNTELWSKKCSIAPWGDHGIRESALTHVSTYPKAQLTVTYESATAYEADPSDDTNNPTLCTRVEQSVSIDSQFLTLSSGKYYWDNTHADAIPDGQSPERIVSIRHYNITLHNVLYFPLEMESLIGTINTAYYEQVWELLAIAEGGVLHDEWVERTGNYLYLGYSMDREINNAGATNGWKVTLSFDEILNGVASNAWNYFYNPNTGEWSRVYDETGAVVDIYESASWAGIGLPPIYVPT